MNQSALIEAPICSTNNAVVEVAETVTYLVQYEYMDEPGTWPARSFTTKAAAQRYANKYNSEHSNRYYTVVPLILEGFAL